MKKVLDIVEPIVSTYTQHAYLQSVLLCNEETKGWLYSNYIQMFLNKDLEKTSWGDFYFPMPYEQRCYESCKWLRVQKIERTYVSELFPDPLDYVKDCIDRKYYVHTFINYYYVSKSRHFGKKNRMHDCLFYGYDEEEQVLYCADFMFANTRFSHEKMTFEEFRLAFVKENVETDNILFNFVYSFSLKEHSSYAYNRGNIIYGLKNYLESSVPEYWRGYNYDNQNDIVWGLNCYDVYIDYISNHDLEIDIRMLHMFMEHKKIMVERIIFLNEESEIENVERFISEYEEMYTDLYKVINLVLKYNICKKTDIKSKICDILSKVRIKEEKCLIDMLNALNSEKYNF